MSRIVPSSILLVLLAGPALAGGETPPATATPPAAPSGEAKPRITLRWSTASESENYGFFVLRGEKEEGPFKSLNERALAGAGTSELPHDYVYEDFDVRPGQVYYYYLESVSTKGDREKFSPVIKQTCCKPPKPKPDAKGEKLPDKPGDTPADKPEKKAGADGRGGL
jgi:hypothetical protein